MPLFRFLTSECRGVLVPAGSLTGFSGHVSDLWFAMLPDGLHGPDRVYSMLHAACMQEFVCVIMSGCAGPGDEFMENPGMPHHVLCG